MKLLVQSDDYAISPAVARGILYGIENGIIRNTGMFMNMPWSVECGKLIMPYLDKLDEIAENCQPSAGAKITACADEIRDLLIGGN